MNVSVFIPTYNSAQWLPQVIDSVLKQTVKPCEILVADDGSTDATREVVAQYGSQITYRYFNHAGVYSIRNEMLKRVKGDWFLNLDADNWIDPDFLEKAVAIICENQDERLAFVYPDLLTFGDYEQRQRVPDFDVNRFKLGNFVDMNSLVRTEPARRLGFDLRFNDGWGDYDFFLSLAERGFYGLPLHTSPLHYRIHAKSITATTAVFDGKQQLMRRIVAKHTSFFSREEGLRAIRLFSPEAVMRHRLTDLWLSRRRKDALLFFLRLLVKHPQAVFSPAVVKRLLHLPTRFS